MSNFEVKINYLYNSGYIVETEKYFLIFDYYRDGVSEKNDENIDILTRLQNVVRDKRIFVFSSHSHEDHFNPEIFGWVNIRHDIKYILSSDIEINRESDNIFSISAYEDLEIDNVYIKAYGSTDIGISFLVKLDDMTIFHAGDLNWWYWWDDTEENIVLAEKQFKNEIEKIKGEKINIAFFPVDPRLEHNYCLGGEYFIEEINPDIFIPMHFWDDYETTKRFAERLRGKSTKIIEITHKGQEIIF